MSERVSYSDDEDYPGQWALWAANNARAIAGKSGQATLRELLQALEAMPEKRLIAGHLRDDAGEVCAMGALLTVRAPDEIAPNEHDRCECGHERHFHDGECTATFMSSWMVPKGLQAQEVPCGCIRFAIEDSQERDWRALGLNPRVCQRIIQMNDLDLQDLTPEQRYDAVVMWVRGELEHPSTVAQTVADYSGWTQL